MATTTLFFIAKINVPSATEIIMSVPVQSSLHLVKKKKGKQKQSSGDQQSFADLRKLYHNLQKEHERVGMVFQNRKEQNEELAWDLAEQEADLEELANLVSTKDEAIKNMERRFLQAKKVIADLNAEVQSLHSHNDLRESDNQQQTPQQQSERERLGKSALTVFLLFTVSTRRYFRSFQRGSCCL